MAPPFCSRTSSSDPKTLTEFSPLPPGGGFLEFFLYVLREVEVDAGELLLGAARHLGDELFFGEPPRPGVERCERRKELRVEEARGVGAVVGAAVLRDHGHDLRKAPQDLPDSRDVRLAGLERDGGRKRRADPEITFLELGQELRAQARDDECADHEERDRYSHRRETETHGRSSAQV